MTGPRCSSPMPINEAIEFFSRTGHGHIIEIVPVLARGPPCYRWYPPFAPVSNTADFVDTTIRSE